MENIVSLLQARGINCTVEYPEFIYIRLPDESYWSFGLVNPTWCGDRTSRDGDELDCARSDLKPDAAPEVVADFIFKTLNK